MDRTELVEGVRALAVCVDRLLSELNTTRGDYWGPEFEDQAAALIREVMDAREVRVQQARSSALLQLARLRALGTEAFEAVVMTLDSNGRQPEEADHDYGEPHVCPVCEYDGWLSGVVERSDLQVDESDSNDVWVDRLFVPREFRCEVCGFTVWNQELPLSGLPVTKQLEPDDHPWELEQIYADVQADAAYEAMRGSGYE